MNNWISVKTALPTKNGSYLTTVQHSNNFSSIMILGFAKDLYKYDKYGFWEYKGKKQSGWYNYDSEYGSYEVHGVIAWQELPPLYKEED